MSVQLEQDEKAHVKKVYSRMMLLAFASHVSFVIIFAIFGFWFLCIYNLLSVGFYLLMQAAVRKGSFRLVVSAIHIETCVFVSLCTMLCGWDIGLAFYLIAVSSLVYFCPFEHKFVPYLFSLLEVAVFVALKLYTKANPPYYHGIPDSVSIWLYIYGVLTCFAVILFAAFSSNITAAVTNQKLQDENRNLNALANYDYLTELLSRRSFLKRLAQCEKGEPVVVAMGDIDDFKHINDTLGHTCGDYVLHDAARIMNELSGADAEACRWGGEEFVFLFRRTSCDEATAIMQKICDAIAAHTFHYEQHSFHVTITFGVCAGTAGPDMQRLIDRADKRMYLGKSQGKNQVVASD